MNTLNKFYDNEELVGKCLEEVNRSYRPLDPGWYLYKKVLKIIPMELKFKDSFCELVYVTLSAWNMNSRGAKLQEFEIFKESICNKKNKELIQSLSKFIITDIPNVNIEGKLKALFDQLDLVAETKPPLVTFSKTMHFLLPNLIVPIDRKYTIQYFYRGTNIPKNKERQFGIFMDIQKECAKFITEYKYFKNMIDDNWNRNLPKIIDNILIGFGRLKSKKKVAKIK